MTPKQLIVAVEGTAAVGPFWKTILSDYLDKIIRSFCGNEPTGQKISTSRVELSLVMFNTHGSYSACLVQRSGWTRDMDTFFQWLSAVPFGGGGFNDAAIAEGLAEALMMFSSPNATPNANVDAQRHCILVAASNPYPLPTPVYRPQPHNPEQSDNIETQPDNRLSNAETLAKSFAQCGISLSVICPKQLPKLRSIYNAGKRNPRAADPPVDNVENPHFLVLVSENFMEGRSAVSRSGVTNIPPNQNSFKMDVTPAPPISTPPPTAVPSANGSVLGRQPLPVGNIPPGTVKVEPTTVTAATGPNFPHVSSVPRSASQPVPSLQTSSPLSTSQEMIPNNDNVPEMKPLVNNMTPSLRPVGGAAANVRILNDVAQARQALAGGTSIGLPSMGGTPMLSNMISSGMASSVPPSQAVISSGPSGITSISAPMPIPATGQIAQNSAPASFTSAAPNAPGNPSVGMSQPLSNLQPSVSMGQTLPGMGQTLPGMGQGNLPATQMVQTGMGVNQNMMNSSGASGVNQNLMNSSGASVMNQNGSSASGMNQNMMNGNGASGIPSGNGAMMPTPGMSQQPGMQPVGMNSNNSVANMPLNQQSSNALQSAQSKYIKVWEGNLSGQRQGQPVFITRLEGYRNASASETLAANWPATMQIVRLISQDHMNNKQYVGKADFLVFRAMNQHGFLGQLQEKKLCAVIQLPSQTLLLSVSDKAYRLIGMLFPGDMVVFKPQIPNTQQQQQQQHLQQLQPNQHIPQMQQQQNQQQLQQIQQQPNQQLAQMQQQQSLMQMQQQMPQLQQQMPQMQQQMPQMQQQMPQMQQQAQQMVGTGSNQNYMQGTAGRAQLLAQQGQVTSQSQGQPTMGGGGGGFMS